jgi:membrane protease YdiL (CAAX protease family)
MPDPDQAAWGPGAGVATWVASAVLSILIPLFALATWYVICLARGTAPSVGEQKELLAWTQTPGSLLIQVLANLPAHLLTLVVCYSVVTGFGRKRPFLDSLGWSWGTKSALFWIVISVAVIVGLMAASQLLSRILPESESSSFDVLLNSTFPVKISLVLVATLSAPFVEEVIYRGVLYGGLRSVLGPAITTAIVTLWFTGVHVPQYAGKYASLTALMLLSLALTVMRAVSRSILPSVLLHFIFNSFESMLILLKQPPPS